MKVTCALILSENKILAVQRGQVQHHAGKWEFPGGKVKENESYEECLKRELREELNIEVIIHDKLDTVFHNYPEFKIELIPFVCEVSKGSLMLKEHAALKWCTFDEFENLDFSTADELLIRGIKKAGRAPAFGNSDKK
jgi:8-oxo-dGTP diphosphatase